MPVIKGNSQNNRLIGEDNLPYGTANEMYGLDGDDWLAGGRSSENYIWGGNGNDQVSGIGTIDRLYGEAGDDYVGSSGQDVQLYGGEGNDTLSGSLLYPSRLDGGTGADRMTGGELGDTFIIDNLEDILIDTYVPYFENQINPTDTAVFINPRLSYEISLGSAVSDAVSSVNVEAMERLAFADGEFRVETADIAAQVYRLYGATLDRTPESDGLKHWVTGLESGSLTLQQATDGFTSSPEFQSKYGNLDNAGFVDLLYENVLSRDPDPVGFQHWLNAMADDTQRSEVVLAFSESAENIELTRPAVEQGIWVRDDQAAMVARLYDTTLDRLPDAQGLNTWVSAIKAGMTSQQAANGFTGSPEFQQKYGSLDDTAFVQQLYRNVLDREGEPSGIEGWKGTLASGISRADVVLGFSESAEHQNKLAPYIDDGIWFL